MSQNQSQHPLPPQPGHQEYGRPTARPRAKSGFSFRSSHSRKSSGSGQKIDLHETHEEKESKRLTSKQDPSMAINEMEPSAVASGGQTSLAPLRALVHKDSLGNPISDPDRSNPTRSRWERPLDTIRSFEAAIDGGYRKSYVRTESSDNFSRKSYYGGTQVTSDERPRFPPNGRNSYYAGGDGRPNQMSRPESYYNSFDNAGPSNGYYPNRARYPRTASEPQFNSGHAVYPVAGAQPSYETIASGSNTSGDRDPFGYATDPSSENSSVDRIAAVPTREPGESYSFNNAQQYSQRGFGLQEQNSPNGQRPPPPPKKEVPPRVPIKLGQSSGNSQPPPAASRPPVGEKRKSWFGRKLSKRA